MKATDVKYIVLHCSAGFGDPEAIQRYWKERLGWKSPGYHILIDLDGVPHQLSDFTKQTNGVRSFNDCSIHICYIGGIEKVNGKYVAKDTRTLEQNVALHKAIQQAIKWLKDNGKDITKDLSIVGHRDFSKDKNGNGVIESWERMKECPSFSVIDTFGYLYSSGDRYNKLPD